MTQLSALNLYFRLGILVICLEANVYLLHMYGCKCIHTHTHEYEYNRQMTSVIILQHIYLY